VIGDAGVFDGRRRFAGADEATARPNRVQRGPLAAQLREHCTAADVTIGYEPGRLQAEFSHPETQGWPSVSCISGSPAGVAHGQSQRDKSRRTHSRGRPPAASLATQGN